MAFYRELLMWAGRLAQYPDPYSFKRRLLNGMPAEYKHHLALYEGISAEHSSIDDIVRRARHLEKTLISLGSGKSTGRQSEDGTSTLPGGTTQKPAGTHERQHPRNPPAKQQPSRNSGNIGAQGQCPAPRDITGDRGRIAAPDSGDRGRIAAPNPVASRGDTSELTCYRCGKPGHIASDPKCLQSKRPEQRQIFAAQVVDDRSDGEHPTLEEPIQDDEGAPELEEEKNLDEVPGEQAAQEDYPDGSQYEDEQSSYEEYDGYEPPSDYEEPVYIRAMSNEAEAGNSPAPINFNDVDWEPRRDAIRQRFQRVPWLPEAHDRRGVLPAVGTAPALAEGTSSIEPASGAEEATATQPEALESTTTGHIHEALSPGGERIRKPEAPPLEGERMVETSPRKRRRVHEALPLEGERERGTMPQQSPCNGVLATLKGTTPGDLEGDLPWDPGEEETVESKRVCKASEHDMAGFDARNKPLTWPPKELVGWHHRNKATTHHYPNPTLPSHRRRVDPFSSLRPIERERVPSWESRSRPPTRNKRFGGRHTRVTRGHAHPRHQPECSHLSRILEGPAYGAAATLAHRASGLGITSSAPSKPSTFLHSTNPSTRPRTGVTMQATRRREPHIFSRLAVHPTATSSTPVAGRLPTPAPTTSLSSARRRCSRRTAPPSSEGGGLTFHLADNTPNTSFEAAAPVLARRISWGCRRPCSSRLIRMPMPLLVATHGAANALARRASVLGGLATPLSATRPSSVGGGLISRLAADTPSTTRLESATPISTHRAASREGLDVRRNSYDADGVLVRLRRVNGDVECDAATASGCCVMVTARRPCINSSCTPWFLFGEPPLPLPAAPSFILGADLALRLAEDAILVPAASASSVIGRTPMLPPATPSFTATSLSTRISRGVSFGLVASPFWMPCSTWIPQSARSTLVLRYLKREITLFLTPLAFVLEREGVRCPILLVTLHQQYKRMPPQVQTTGTHDYVCAITCSTRWLFYQPGRNCKALAYVNRIRHTPPELHDEFHQRALDRWTELQATRRQERKERSEVAGRPREPMPYNDLNTWKKWLRIMRDHPHSEGRFKFPGAPCVCKGYQVPHIEGVRAMLEFLPRRKGSVVRGPLRDVFLRNAAILLCVPEQYQRVTTQIGVTITTPRRKQRYTHLPHCMRCTA